MLLGITYYCWVDVNVVEVYTSCIEQFWATVKAKTVNGEGQLQALVDGKKILITESTIRRDLQLEDNEGVGCLPNAVIFEQLTLMGMSNHNRIYVTPSHIKKIFRNMKRVGKGFSRRETPLFPTMMIQAQEDIGEGSANPTDPHHTPTIIQPSTSQPQKTKQRRKPRKKFRKGCTTATSLDAEWDKGNIFKTQSKTTPNEPGSQRTSSGGVPRCQETIGDTVAQTSLKLTKLMELCTKLQQKVLDLETTKTTQVIEIDSLKRIVKRLERRKRSRNHGRKRLYKVILSTQVESSKDKGLGEEDASKHGRIGNIDANEDIYLVNVYNDEDMFGVNDLVVMRKPTKKVTQVPQPSDPIEHLVDEAVYKELGDSLVRAAITASSLETEQDSGNINKNQSKVTPNESSSQGTDSGGGPRCQEAMRDTTAQTRFESVSKLSNDSLLVRGNILQSDKDRMKLNELMELCTILQRRVFDLGKIKTTQSNEISSLKMRVKKLEKRNMSRTHKLKRLYKVGLTARVESSKDEESLENDSSLLEEKSSSASKRRLDKVVKSSQSGTSQSCSSSDSLGFGTRFLTLDFMNSSDSFSGIVSRCSSLMMRESFVDKIGESSETLGLFVVVTKLETSYEAQS
nr:hypothetical protein [Tanacetum cinerariifolium]